MSDTMLLGVLRMPVELWDTCDELIELDKRQRHSRYLEAAERIEADAARIAELEQQLKEAGQRECALAASLAHHRAALYEPAEGPKVEPDFEGLPSAVQGVPDLPPSLRPSHDERACLLSELHGADHPGYVKGCPVCEYDLENCDNSNVNVTQYPEGQ